MTRTASLAVLLLLAACAQPPRQAPLPAPPPLRQPAPGLARIMGLAPDAVIAVLGSPTLDRGEGAARHLQFARLPCVLDVFFYPQAGGVQSGGVQARYAEARQRDGRAFDAGACIEAQLRVQPLG